MTWQRRLWKQLQVRCLTSSSSHPPKTYFLTFDDKEKRIFKYNTMYLAFFPLIHLWEYCKQAAGLLWLSHLSLPGKTCTDKQQVKGALRFILLEVYLSWALSIYKNQLDENITKSCLVSMPATSAQKGISVSLKSGGQQVWDVNVSHYTHNNWPKNPSRWLTPYAVAPPSSPSLFPSLSCRMTAARQAWTCNQGNHNTGPIITWRVMDAWWSRLATSRERVEIVLKERRERRKSHPVGMQPMDTPQYQPIIACFRYAWCSCLATVTVPREGRGRVDWFGILALQLVSIAEK